MKQISSLFFRAISVIFHPLLMLTYILLSLYWMNPILFSNPKPEFKGVLFFNIFFATFLIPFIAILMMRFMKLIPSLEMPEKQHRIGPLIATAIFYLWIYINVSGNPEIPPELSMCMLGVLITLFLAFFINIFRKVSLHTAGAGGLIASTSIFVFSFLPFELIIYEGVESTWAIHPLLFLSIILIIGGLIGSARLYLKAHSPNEVYGGYFLGIAGQMIAFMYTF